ncbi:hypothetical protein LTR66_011675 [Elasticomyces elasticus]|nr:hypothetical protein LTR66_011675 [Elasticomyces elasticus]
MDPLSALGLAHQIYKVVDALWTYAQQVKEAKKDIISLATELSALRGVLENVAQQQKVLSPDNDARDVLVAKSLASGELRSLMLATESILKEFCDMLGYKDESLGITDDSRIKRTWHALRWPFKQGDVQQYLNHLERIKSSFVLAMVADMSDVHRRTYSGLIKVISNQQDDREERLRVNEKLARQKLLQRLSPVDPKIVHSKTCRARHEGTGTWFIQKYFDDWSMDPRSLNRVLWLKGKLGAGKTTLFSRIVEEAKSLVKKSDDVGLAYFYCAFNDDASQDLSTILGSLVAQLSENMPEILDKLKEYSDKQEDFPIGVLEETIAIAARSYWRVLLCFDAINESKRSREIAASLERILRVADQIQVLVTCTPELENLFEHLEISESTVVNMHVEDVAPDINAYVDFRIEKTEALSALSPKGKGEVRNAVVGQADGMFRWVQCQLDYLGMQLTGRDVKRALKDLPSDLNATYIAMLSRVTHKSYVKEALLWLSYSHRPLRLEELSEAVTLDLGTDEIDIDSRLPSPQTIITICQGLVVYDERT